MGVLPLVRCHESEARVLVKVGPEMRPRENACRVPGADEAPTYDNVVLSIKAGGRVILKLITLMCGGQWVPAKIQASKPSRRQLWVARTSVLTPIQEKQREESQVQQGIHGKLRRERYIFRGSLFSRYPPKPRPRRPVSCACHAV